MTEICSICGKELKTLTALRAHLTLKHHIEYENHRDISETIRNYENKKEKAKEVRKIDYNMLLYLTKEIPDGLDFNKEKEPISPKIRKIITTRDRGICRLCNSSKGKHIHHRIPNGGATEDNLFTLCTHCHQIAHELLYLDNKWKHRFSHK